MDSHLKVIEALAHGIDPTTGEMLPNESPYSNPEVIRALFFALDYIKNPPKKMSKPKKTTEQKQRENLANGLPRNAGLPWTDQQRQELSQQFKNEKTVASLAVIHERSHGAITSELKKQGLIED